LSAQRLVKQEHLRPVDQRPRQRHPLLLAAGQLLGLAFLIPGQPHHFERLGDAPADFAAVNLLHLESKGHILADGHVWEEGVALKDRVDGALKGRRLAHGAPVNQNLALGGQLKAGNHAQRCRLATAGRTQQRKKFAVADLH
jgi:hypothetical protein